MSDISLLHYYVFNSTLNGLKYILLKRLRKFSPKSFLDIFIIIFIFWILEQFKQNEISTNIFFHLFYNFYLIHFINLS